MLSLHIAFVLVLATTLAWWCGWGLARLTLPSALLPFRRLLAPLIGYAVVVVAGYWSVRTVIGLNVALPILLLVCTMLNILAWRRTGAPFTRRLPGQVTQREGVSLFLLVLMTIGVGVAPLIRYNQSAAIGGGWDIEVALPMARYLERAPIAAIATMPDNPLRDLVANPPRISHNIGFAIYQGCVDLLGGFEVFDTFTPLIAWLRGLGVLAVYLWLRVVLGLRLWVALIRINMGQCECAAALDFVLQFRETTCRVPADTFLPGHWYGDSRGDRAQPSGGVEKRPAGIRGAGSPAGRLLSGDHRMGSVGAWVGRGAPDRGIQQRR
jgi:hypothetical protein